MSASRHLAAEVFFAFVRRSVIARAPPARPASGEICAPIIGGASGEVNPLLGRRASFGALDQTRQRVVAEDGPKLSAEGTGHVLSRLRVPHGPDVDRTRDGLDRQRAARLLSGYALATPSMS